MQRTKAPAQPKGDLLLKGKAKKKSGPPKGSPD
jgi:hypothetical protein